MLQHKLLIHRKVTKGQSGSLQQDHQGFFGPRHSSLTACVRPGPARLSLAKPTSAMPVAASAPHRVAPAKNGKYSIIVSKMQNNYKQCQGSSGDTVKASLFGSQSAA